MSDDPWLKSLELEVSYSSETVATAIAAIEESVGPRRSHCLVVIHGHDLGRKYDLGAEALTIGRSRDNDICIDEKGVSRKHCELGIEKRGAYLRDLRSTNGTFVNDQSNPIQSTYLNDGDRIRIGRTIFKYVSGANIEAAYHEQLLRLSTTDGLTQVFNRRYFDETLDRELRRARRYDRPLALLLFDIDHLRPCNDTHGHRAGDFVLRKVAELATLRARKVDIVARHGGEEFAILCPELVDPDASVFAERLRTAVQEHEFEFEGQRIPVTISIGLAIATPPHPQGYDLLAAADQCLHQAKANGRNQVVVEQLAPAVAAERADVEVSVTIAVPRAQISGPSLDVAFPLLSRLAAAFGAAAVDQFRTGAHARLRDHCSLEDASIQPTPSGFCLTLPESSSLDIEAIEATIRSQPVTIIDECEISHLIHPDVSIQLRPR